MPRRSKPRWVWRALRLADADGLSFDYTDYANEIREFFRETVRIAGRRNLASAFDEKAMNEAVDDFAKEAERMEKARLDAVKSGDREKLARLVEQEAEIHAIGKRTQALRQ